MPCSLATAHESNNAQDSGLKPRVLPGLSWILNRVVAMVHMRTSKRSTTTKKVRAAEKEDPRLINLILTDVSSRELKLVRAYDIRDWGYLLDVTRKKFVQSSYELWPVLDEDTGREVSFSFLLNRTNNMGVVLPHPYCHYTEAEQ